MKAKGQYWVSSSVAFHLHLWQSFSLNLHLIVLARLASMSQGSSCHGLIAVLEFWAHTAILYFLIWMVDVKTGLYGSALRHLPVPLQSVIVHFLFLVQLAWNFWTQASLRFGLFLLLPAQCWNYRYTSLCLALWYLLVYLISKLLILISGS